MLTDDNPQPFNCPLCNHNQYKEIKVFEDEVIVGKCNKCELLYTPKRHNTPEDLFGEISSEKIDMIFKPILNGNKRHFRYNIFKKYHKKIAQYAKGNKHLDIGCAHGFFIDYARSKGLQVTGIEPNKEIANFGRNYLNLNIINGTLDQINLTEKWDIISFTDSLEYFKTPISDLSSLVENNLNQNGIIFIKVPNGDYFFARHLIKTKLGIGFGGAEAFSPSKRVTHFNIKTLKNLINSLELDVLEGGFFIPINSPIWYKYTGIHLEIENPWYLGLKERILRNILHFIGCIEFVFFRKNHFSQAVYVIAVKK